MKRYLGLYSFRLPHILTYMLQASEYATQSYLKWLWRTDDLASVMQRQTLDKTKIARLIVLFLTLGMLLQYVLGLFVFVRGVQEAALITAGVGVFIFLITPILWAHLVVVPVALARKFLIEPQLRAQQAETERILATHPATIIAVAGSYGKTTMKEILVTVLSQGKKVAATPANKNVATAHYQFAKSLTGDEEVIIIEYGESKPGDVAQFADTTGPDIGVITGLAPAHLEGYGSVEAAGRDIFALADHLQNKTVYVNEESSLLQSFLKPGHYLYSQKGVGEWRASKIDASLNGLSFALGLDDQHLYLESKLLGVHLVGVLSAAAVIALELGLSEQQVQTGIALTKPFEHRMQPYQLGGAWIIDDAYNGNIEGVRAGTQLLGALEARRKWYVTPGLVEQGGEVIAVHHEMGRLIAAAKPDIVVLMQNSVTEYIRGGLGEAGYGGEVRIEHNPLQFYTHMEQLVAAGDIVMLQNDWTDNYN